PCIPREGPLKQYLPVTVDPVPVEEQHLWNATVAAYHPLGYRQPFGAHQRYWIHSRAEGKVEILGALLFAAAARKVAVREAWIGWTALERNRFRYRIVNNSRFLILPGVQIPHLASHALALAARRIRADWQKRYGYAPVLFETFVTPPHQGTCYRAANWQYIGETAGLGREPRKQKSRPVIRMMFVYPLVREWRAELCAPTPVAGDDYDA
ncbi:MAG: Druantia anti-phage system protein DruA, partial [Bacillota bacterium]